MKYCHIILFVFLLTAVTPAQQSTLWQKLGGGLNFPEGPAWDGEDKLYFSNCYGGWIGLFKEGRLSSFQVDTLHKVRFKNTNGLAFDNQGNLYACDFGLGAILRFTKTGICSYVSQGYGGKKYNRPNDLAFDANGGLYFTDPHSYGSEKHDGAVYYLPAGSDSARQVIYGLAFPNGLAFTADNRFLYICESALERILRFPVKDDASLGNFEIFAEVPGGDPDGIAFDLSGNLYVAHFGAGEVIVFSNDGNVVKKIPTPGKKPTNIEFGGKDMKTLFLTEAGTNSLYSTKVTTPGLPLNPFRGR